MTLRLAGLTRHASDPQATAITCGPESLSWAELEARCAKVADSLLALGLGAGDRIVLLLPGVHDFPVAFLGAHRAGLVVIPLNPLLGVGELRGILAAMRPAAIVTLSQGSPLPAIQALPAIRAEVASEARLYVSGPLSPADLENGAVAFADLMTRDAQGAPIATARDVDDEAVILFTSGTTGAPKGVSHSEASLMTNALAVVSQLNITPADVVLSPLPPSHVFGLVVGLLGSLAAGAAVVLVPRPAPDQVYDAITQHAPTLMLAVPATLAAVARLAEAAPAGQRRARALRAVATGGAPLPPAVGEDFCRVFETRVVQGYGMTETAGLISLPELAAGADPTSVGRVLPGFEHRLAPVGDAEAGRGELQLRSGPLFRGLYIDGVFQARDLSAWFSTGDLVEIDGSGRMRLYDRRKELIIRGGYNVYPSEVEAVLTSHPDVVHAAVVGIPDAEVGEEVVAFVTLAAKAQTTPEGLIAWSRSSLATYKYPRHVVLLGEMPLTPSGKILKRALPVSELAPRALAQAGRA